jgi:hypothetical protein
VLIAKPHNPIIDQLAFANVRAAKPLDRSPLSRREIIPRRCKINNLEAGNDRTMLANTQSKQLK